MINFRNMKTLQTTIIAVVLAMLAVSCGNTDIKNGALKSQKAKLEKLKTQRGDLDKKITALEVKIAKEDTSAVVEEAKLVALSTLEKVEFKHYLELSGKVDDQNVSYITPSGQPGQIKAIYVKEGDHIHKGQLILRLDNSVAMQQVDAIKQQKSSIVAQLNLARSIYERQKNLWDQNIGTEVQLLQAKTNVESLEGQLKSVEANVKAALVQAGQSSIYSDVNGIVDKVTAHVGETFNGNPLTGGYIRIVNKSSMKISVVVPENYIGQVQKGTPVAIKYGDGNKAFDGTISFLSRSIDPSNSGFTAEIKVPSGTNVLPNQMVRANIMDYKALNAITVPLNTVQNDEEGKYVMAAVKEGGHLVARKKHVILGELYDGKIEIKEGLKAGDRIIASGFEGLFEGESVTLNQD